MKKGALFPMRIADPSELLSLYEGKTPGAHILLGAASASSLFHTLPILSTDSTGRNYGILIPFDTAIKIIVSTSFFQLADATGLPLPRGITSQIPVTVQSGTQPTLLKLTVTAIIK